MSTETSIDQLPASPAVSNVAPSASPAVSASQLEKPPGVISLMCPMGFTPYAIEGLSINQPLFARVTYRPE